MMTGYSTPSLLGSCVRGITRYPAVRRVLHAKTAVSGKKKAIKFKFVDKVRVVATGGMGGSGCVSLEGESPLRRKPSGGSGGAGGNVYVVADAGVESLNFPLHHYNAANGGKGGRSGKKGRRGKDRYVRVPCGTLVVEATKDDVEDAPYAWMLNGGIDDPEGCSGVGNYDSVEEEEEEEEVAGGEGQVGGERLQMEFEKNYIVSEDEEEGEEEVDVEGGMAARVPYATDLANHGDKILLASGGRPGLGNMFLASRRVGNKQPGQRGETRHYTLELRTIADVGLVGYPNAGKSTLLGRITNAKPKVAVYPFTTLSPVVGQVEYSDTVRIKVADIPGLIEGAHLNKGLGHEFLRHVVRTKVLVLVVDAAGSEGRDPAEDLRRLREELRLYDPALAKKAMFVAANKTDLPASKGWMGSLRAAARPLPVVPLSALEHDGLMQVAVKIRHLVEDTDQAYVSSQ